MIDYNRLLGHYYYVKCKMQDSCIKTILLLHASFSGWHEEWMYILKQQICSWFKNNAIIHSLIFAD